jgi:hypothetical protein
MGQAIIAEIAPRFAIEWLLAFEAVELSWDIQRYRVLRYKVLETYRQQAIERALSRIDLVGVPPDLHEKANYDALYEVFIWPAAPRFGHARVLAALRLLKWLFKVFVPEGIVTRLELAIILHV